MRHIKTVTMKEEGDCKILAAFFTGRNAYYYAIIDQQGEGKTYAAGTVGPFDTLREAKEWAAYRVAAMSPDNS